MFQSVSPHFIRNFFIFYIIFLSGQPNMNDIMKTVRHTNTNQRQKTLFLMEIYTQSQITQEYTWEKCAIFFSKSMDDQHAWGRFLFVTATASNTASWHAVRMKKHPDELSNAAKCSPKISHFSSLQLVRWTLPVPNIRVIVKKKKKSYCGTPYVTYIMSRHFAQWSSRSQTSKKSSYPACLVFAHIQDPSNALIRTAGTNQAEYVWVAGC